MARICWGSYFAFTINLLVYTHRSVQKSNLIHLTTEDECGTRAVLQVTSLGAKISERESTWIWIEETTSQKSLRCEVFIDFISRIEILTTTRTLNRYDLVSIMNHNSTF